VEAQKGKGRDLYWRNPQTRDTGRWVSRAALLIKLKGKINCSHSMEGEEANQSIETPVDSSPVLE
jgi:hypothetical protein